MNGLIVVLLFAVASCSILVEPNTSQKKHMTSQARTVVTQDRSEGQQCQKKNQLDLVDANFHGSDVIMTGTIVKLVPEVHVDASRKLVYENLTITAHVKPWRVIKGSLDGVLSARSESKRLRRIAREGKKGGKKVAIRSLGGASERVKSLTRETVRQARRAVGGGRVLKIHGFWNADLCGSFLRDGETRIFFLRKMEDHRGRRHQLLTSSVGGDWKRLKRKRRHASSSSILLLSNEPALVSMSVLDHVTNLAKR